MTKCASYFIKYIQESKYSYVVETLYPFLYNRRK